VSSSSPNVYNQNFPPPPPPLGFHRAPQPASSSPPSTPPPGSFFIFSSFLHQMDRDHPSDHFLPARVVFKNIPHLFPTSRAINPLVAGLLCRGFLPPRIYNFPLLVQETVFTLPPPLRCIWAPLHIRARRTVLFFFLLHLSPSS